LPIGDPQREFSRFFAETLLQRDAAGSASAVVTTPTGRTMPLKRILETTFLVVPDDANARQQQEPSSSRLQHNGSAYRKTCPHIIADIN